MSDQTCCLLDKVTARRILEGLLKLAEARALTAEEAMALVLYDAARADGTPAMRHFVVPPTERVLQRLEEHARYAALIQLFRQRVEVVFPTRYFKMRRHHIHEATTVHTAFSESHVGLCIS